MTLALFKRAGRSLLSLLGEEAFFHGVATKINIERDVEFSGFDGESGARNGDLTVTHDVATISKELDPRTRETFTMVEDGITNTYRLERRIQDAGVNPRFIILKTN